MRKEARLVWFFVFTAIVSGQTLALKGLVPGRTEKIRKLASPGLRRAASRSHLLVQFADNPTEDQIADLRNRGVSVIGYIPDFAFTAAADDSAQLDEAGLKWYGRLQAEEKLSPLLGDQAPADGAIAFVVQFYSDVDPNDARALLSDAGFAIRENPDLLPAHLLTTGSFDQALGLAAWDEVEYIFPASDDLVSGNPLRACAGALTAQGQVGQSVAKVGDGWDGPGRGGADLKYAFAALTPKLHADAAQAEIARAFAEWAKYAKLTFTPTDQVAGPRTVSVLFGSYAHGDPYPFDGPGGVLAHTFYPYPVNQEPIAGDMHLDDSENWRIGADVDVFSVALHEAGHALGLGHSDRPGAVMYPYYRKAAALTQEDIGAVLTLYAAQDGSAPPSAPAGPSGGGSPARPAPLVLTVRDPGASTAAASIGLSGTVTGGSGSALVTWSTNQGASGAAQGSANWSIAAIPLNPGANAITIAVRDGNQGQAAATLTVTRVQSTVRDSTPPSLTIVAPAFTSVSTSASTITVSGTARDNTAVAVVTWSNSNGGSGTAAGTSNWSTPPIPLLVGTNTLTIRASDPAGNVAWRSIVVTRR